MEPIIVDGTLKKLNSVYKERTETRSSYICMQVVIEFAASPGREGIIGELAGLQRQDVRCQINQDQKVLAFTEKRAPVGSPEVLTEPGAPSLQELQEAGWEKQKARLAGGVARKPGTFRG